MPSATRTLFTLAALCLVATMASKCREDCTAFKMEAPPKPEEPGINTGEAVAKVGAGWCTFLAGKHRPPSQILDGLFSFLRAKNWGEAANNFGYMAGGLFTGIWGASQAQEQSKWAEYKLQTNFKQTQDYLACVMESQVSGAIYDINQRLDQDQINAFNNAINAVVSYVQDTCVQHNCLNFSTVEPSKRNAATGNQDASCVAAYTPIASSDCSNVVWDPMSPRLCKGSDRTGGVYDGVCGEDGMCYYTRVGFQGTIEAYQSLKNVFLEHPAINNFQAFDKLLNPNAVVAYAKATSVYMAVMQELYFLGSASAEEANMKAFAGRAAAWLQERVDFHTNYDVSMKTVLDASSFAEPMSVRSSCKAEDVVERWWGCSYLSFATNKQYCLINPGKLGNNDKLCADDCSTADMQSQLGMRADLYTINSADNLLKTGANQLSAKNKKLFENGGVYRTIQSLRTMSTMNPLMPAGSFKAYQDQYTPRLACKPVVQGTRAPLAVAPLGTWEAPDNLRKGSVVVRGKVIGGEAMQRVGGVASKTVAPKAAAKAPAPARRLLM